MLSGGSCFGQHWLGAVHPTSKTPCRAVRVSETKSSLRKKYCKKSFALCGLALLVIFSACQGIVGGPPQIPLPPPNPNATFDNSVNHIIFMMQENRSFDAYFGKLNDFRSGTFALGRDTDDLESVFTNPADDGTLVPNFHLTTGCIFNTTAAWLESWGDMNRFAAPDGPLLLDGFVHTAGLHAVTDGDPDSRGVRAMGFYDGGDLTRPYWLASEFATSDRFYSPAPLQTEVVRLWAMAATSQGFTHPPAETNGSLTATTIFQLLDAAKVSWKISRLTLGATASSLPPCATFSRMVSTRRAGSFPSPSFLPTCRMVLCHNLLTSSRLSSPAMTSIQAAAPTSGQVRSSSATSSNR